MTLALLALLAFAAPPADTDPPVISHVAVVQAPAGKAIVIKAKITDKSEVFAPSVLVRPKGSAEFDSVSMRKAGEGFEATIPAEQVSSDLEYFIEAFDEHGNGPARDGSPEKPYAIQVYDASKPPPPLPAVPPPAPPGPAVGATGEVEPAPGTSAPVYKKWWFWTLIGVAAAGGATAVVILTRPREVSMVDIEVRGPDPVAGL